MTEKRRAYIHALGWAAALYALLVAAMTFPSIANLGRAVAGFEGLDSLQYTWSLWWSSQAWAAGQSPANVSLLYHPWGGDHALLAVTPLLDAVAFPLEQLFSPTMVYNLLFLGSFWLAAISMYLLARDVIGKALPAFLAGLIWAFYPNRMGHALSGHLTQLTSWLFPLLALAMLRLFRQPSWRKGISFGLLLGLSGMVALVQTAYFVLPFCGIMLVGLCLIHRQSFSRDHVLGLGVGLLLALLIMLPSYGPFVWDALRQGTDLDVGGAVENSVDLLSLVTPSPYHPLWRRWLAQSPPLLRIFPEPNELERTGYLGIAVLVLALCGLGRRQWKLWAALVLVGIVFSLGPELLIGGKTTGIAMPYSWFARLPFFSWGRTPERFGQLAVFGLTLLAAQGMARWRPNVWASAAIGLLVVVDLLVLWPFPMGTLAPPQYLGDWRDQSTAVLDLPIRKRQIGNLAMYYQTEHNLAIVGGYIHRDLPGMRDYTKAINAAVTDLGKGAQRPMTPVEVQGLLQGLDIGHVLLHRQFVREEWVADQAQRLEAALGPPNQVDAQVIAYDVRGAKDPSVAMVTFGKALALTDVRTNVAVVPGQTMTVTLEWQCLRPKMDDYTVFVHLLDEQGERVAQHDGQPVGGNWPTSLWAPSAWVIDQHGLDLPGDLPAGTYDLRIGWYDLASGERLPARAGQPGETQAYLLDNVVRVLEPEAMDE